MAKKGGLGRGLGALIPGEDSSSDESSGSLVPVELIVPNPLQPRTHMADEELQELAESIREHGIIQPLIVTHEPDEDRYILIAGERRLRAARIAGLRMVPVIIRQVTDQERLELALIENVQRSDLSALETAEAYRQLSVDFGLSHEEIADQVGKSRVAVTNTLRLLDLSKPVQEALAGAKISEGHARALLGLRSPQAQAAALSTILARDLTVRQTEALVRKLNGEKPATLPHQSPPAEIKDLEDRLRQTFGTKVALKRGKRGGTITIHYYSDEELDSLVQRFLQDSR
jgi:ParB family chromosome partitioning protein